MFDETGGLQLMLGINKSPPAKVAIVLTSADMFKMSQQVFPCGHDCM